MAFELKPNSGSLFKNDKKEKETHPDYKGSALINGVEYWVSGWKRKKNDGEAYVNFVVEPKKGGPKRQDEDF